MTLHDYIDSRHDHLCRCQGCNPQPSDELDLVKEPEDLVAILLAALVQAQSYLDSYDTSRPSRVQAETRRIVAEALGAASQSTRLQAEWQHAFRTAKAARR